MKKQYKTPNAAVTVIEDTLDTLNLSQMDDSDRTAVGFDIIIGNGEKA